MRARLGLVSISCGLLLAACEGGAQSLPDGGVFQIPDSGFIYDSGPPVVPDSGVTDSGPFVCNTTCESGTVCGCPDTPSPSCGCNPPATYAAACDPQVAESCRAPYHCVVVRKLSGPVYQCTDGREGAHCSHADESCTTALGCVCQSDFLGTQCMCRGDPGENPTTCDVMVPASCPNGTCVRVEVQGHAYFVCSDGARYQPCVRGDNSCQTSLGCTCAFAGAHEICTCSEPGTSAGEPCDPREPDSCVPPLVCQTRFDEEHGGHVSECTSSSGPGRGDGGINPYECDPEMPMCPPMFTCEESRAGQFRCTPER
jgi:hypothetical protein